MTYRVMQISFLPQDMELVKGFVYSKGYLNRVTYNLKQDGLSIDMSKVKDYDELCTDMTELIISLLKKRNLKDYICKTYTNINDNEKESVYLEALGLLEKKQNLIKETIYNKISDLIVENENLNLDLDGFFKFRMKDFVSYISIISDIALEEHLIKRDRKEFLDALKYFIDIQEEKMDLLRITITKQGYFVLSNENGDEIKNLNNEEIKNIAMEENLNNEEMLISAIMTLCPKKIEILDKLNNEKTKNIKEVVSSLFEGKVTIIYSN